MSSPVRRLTLVATIVSLAAAMPVRAQQPADRIRLGDLYAEVERANPRIAAANALASARAGTRARRATPARPAAPARLDELLTARTRADADTRHDASSRSCRCSRSAESCAAPAAPPTRRPRRRGSARSDVAWETAQSDGDGVLRSLRDGRPARRRTRDAAAAAGHRAYRAVDVPRRRRTPDRRAARAGRDREDGRGHAAHAGDARDDGRAAERAADRGADARDRRARRCRAFPTRAADARVRSIRSPRRSVR